jgi:hypothetical protein
MSMLTRAFYDALFAPLVARYGPLDAATLTAIVGFDAGGPISLCTIGRDRHAPLITYVTCELAVRQEQVESEFGRYELLTAAQDEDWAHAILTDVGAMTLETAFGHHDTLDIGPWVDPTDPVQGILFALEYEIQIEGKPYGVLRCVGLKRSELERIVAGDSNAVVAELQRDGRYGQG